MTHNLPAAGFADDGGWLSCDGLRVAALAETHGTPLYVYSAATIRDRYGQLDQAFGPYPHALHYALKANSSLGVIRLLGHLGSGVDANSGGEIEVALRAGFRPAQIVFSGVGKTTAELERAVALGVKAINAESPGEVARIDGVARRHGTTARVALRVNPDIEPNTHPHISTGQGTSKFGMGVDQVRWLGQAMGDFPSLILVGLHVHIGSQLVALDPLVRAATLVVALAGELRDAGLPLEYLDLGGGLGVAYEPGTCPPTMAEYVAGLLEVVRPAGFPVALEPGRLILAPAGALVARVVDLKEQGGRRVAVLDAGMTELIRPALYGAYHRIVPVSPLGGALVAYDIVGPLCESSDRFGARSLPALEVGDTLAVLDVGAYGLAMGSNYNRRVLPPEVMVEAGRSHLIRRRQTIDDLLSCEL